MRSSAWANSPTNLFPCVFVLQQHNWIPNLPKTLHTSLLAVKGQRYSMSKLSKDFQNKINRSGQDKQAWAVRHNRSISTRQSRSQLNSGNQYSIQTGYLVRSSPNTRILGRTPTSISVEVDITIFVSGNFTTFRWCEYDIQYPQDWITLTAYFPSDTRGLSVRAQIRSITLSVGE